MRSRYLVVALMIAGVSVPLRAQSVHAGVEAWQKSDYSGAVAIWRPRAEKGDADAAFNLGQAYRLGRGVPQDLAAAQDWLERAARKGQVDAQATLGFMLFQSGNQAGGLRWLRMAANSGDPRAMLVYGSALFNGEGVPRDPLLGYLYVTRAAETGLDQARMTLQRMDEVLPAEDRQKALQLSLPKPGEAPEAVTKAAKKETPSKAVKIAAAPVGPKPLRVAAAPPAAKPAPKPAAAATGNWRIQLGAFSKRSSAEALFGKLSGKSALSGRGPFYVPAGAITRLQVGPFESQAAAQAACNDLKPLACFPVAAK